jgi:hypothetical protein
VTKKRVYKTQYGFYDYEDRRGDATRAAPGCPFASINTISFITMMKMEYFIPGIWYCGSNLYQTSMFSLTN